MAEHTTNSTLESPSAHPQRSAPPIVERVANLLLVSPSARAALRSCVGSRAWLGCARNHAMKRADVCAENMRDFLRLAPSPSHINARWGVGLGCVESIRRGIHT